ncbi:MAG TPA: hypothetical protein VFW86_03015 [Candidatus Limnocylindrales bacterium]|nr:hypothetical protein [Candidatus Limnocylindrales bacterium]
MLAEFTASLRKSPNPGGWTYVVWDESASFFGTHGRSARSPATR